MDEQKQIYTDQIDNWRYRFLFRQFFGRLQHLGRHPDLLKHAKEDMAGTFYERIKRDWLEVPVQDNYLFRFILQGFMKQDVTLPLWTQPESFSAIKERASDIQFVHQSIVDYLEQSEDSFDAINLSNISEIMTEKESNHLFDLCRAHINPNGHLLVWNNMVDRRPCLRKAAFHHYSLIRHDILHFYSTLAENMC